MNILYLKYAVTVARCGSITGAAEQLYMNQPNLSKAIKELETSLNITIFQRTSTGVIPTAQGQEFLDAARQILQHPSLTVGEIKNCCKSTVYRLYGSLLLSFIL